MGSQDAKAIIVDDREIRGALVNQVDEAMTWFRERLTTGFNIVGKAERDLQWEYPLDAIQEAAVNLLCHRDYAHRTHSQIRLYDDRLEFWNSGALPSTLTPEDLFEEHDSILSNGVVGLFELQKSWKKLSCQSLSLFQKWAIQAYLL